jgi:excisionase family DNA binding protein
MAEPKFTLDGLIDVLAERVAAKVRAEIAQDGAAGVRPRLLSIEQAAVYLGRSKEAVQHMIAASKIPAVRSDRRVFIDSEDLDRWIQQNKS